MANLVRSAKSSNDWTRAELAAYNIQVVDQSLNDFFSIQHLPALPPSLSAFSTTERRTNAPDDETHKLLHHLELIHTPRFGQGAAVSIFAEKLLNKLGYAAGHRIIMIQQALPLLICGTNCSAQTNVCVIDDNSDILMLVQEDNQWEHPGPQVIAEAIAAFQCNNWIRKRELHLPVLLQMMIPAITMYGTSPIFYKIMVTAALNDAVMTGTFPVIATTVYCHVPKLPCHNHEGMKPLPNRTVLLQYLEAFRQFV